MAGAKQVHLFGLPPQSGGATSPVAAAAARRGIALLRFDTIQELLNDVLGAEQPTGRLQAPTSRGGGFGK
jgi:hypothetical protein